MPAYSFKARFVEFVKNGSKPGTIRDFRKYPTVAGQLAHLYYAMRTKSCTKLVAVSPKIRAVNVLLVTNDRRIMLFDTNWIDPSKRDAIKNGKYSVAGCNHRVLTASEANELAWKDGFRHSDDAVKVEGCFDMMLDFWQQTHSLPFLGNHIIWSDYKY